MLTRLRLEKLICALVVCFTTSHAFTQEIAVDKASSRNASNPPQGGTYSTSWAAQHRPNPCFALNKPQMNQHGNRAHIQLAAYGQGSQSANLQQSTSLYYLGNPGQISATVTATDSSGTSLPSGTYNWSISSSSPQISFSSTSSSATTSTTTASVPIYSVGGSASGEAVTVSLSATVCSIAYTGSYSTSVDSPYQLTAPSDTQSSLDAGCDAYGPASSTYNNGYYTQHVYSVLSRLTGQPFNQAVYSGENLSSGATNVANNWQYAVPNSAYFAAGEQFVDIGAKCNPAGAAPPLSPLPVPFGTVATYQVRSLAQTICVSGSMQATRAFGENTCADGLYVQSAYLLNNIDRDIVACAYTQQSGQKVSC